jgi:hypothetical protein
MKRTIVAALALIFAIGLLPQTARAQDNNGNAFWAWLTRGQDPRLFWGGVGIGIGTDVASYYLVKKHGTPPHRPMTAGAAYGVTTFACAVAYPFVGTWLLNRPLTPREMYDGVADCVVPFVGGWIVDAMLPHDAWTDGTPPKPVRHHK